MVSGPGYRTQASIAAEIGKGFCISLYRAQRRSGTLRRTHLRSNSVRSRPTVMSGRRQTLASSHTVTRLLIPVVRANSSPIIYCIDAMILRGRSFCCPREFAPSLEGSK